MSEPEFVCARCAKLGKTCCQKTQVFTTRGDVARIEKTIGTATRFHESAPPASPENESDPELDPIWHRIFDRSGKRRILAHRPNGDCIFLGDKGCTLAEQVRPLVCRLYPYDYNHIAIKGVDGHFCPEPERANAPLLLALLGMGRDSAEQARQQLYAEIRDEYPA